MISEELIDRLTDLLRRYSEIADDLIEVSNQAIQSNLSEEDMDLLVKTIDRLGFKQDLLTSLKKDLCQIKN